MGFEIFPPEINSGLMYSGPGSGSMIAAAAAWDGLAADLYATAASYGSVISGLTAGSWLGPSSMSMAAAAAPYVSWMSVTAAQAEQVAAQAKAAAAAYETAFAMTVPPPVIEANRALLMSLVATNFFGQNTPAIAATEAHYAEMWAQDGLAMNGYAVSSAQATALSPLTDPPPTTSAAGMAGPLAQAVGGNPLATLWQLISQLPTTLAGLTTAPGSPLAGFTGLIDALGLGTFLTPTGATQLIYLGSVPARFALYPISYLMRFAMMGANSGSLAGNSALMEGVNTLVNAKMAPLVNAFTHLASATAKMPTMAHMGQAPSIGGLSVPPGWGSAAQALERAAPVLPNTSVSAPSISGIPGGSFGQALMGALAGRGLGGIAAKIPGKVIPRSVAGG